MGIPFTRGMGFLLTATMGKLFTMTMGIQLTISRGSTKRWAIGRRTRCTSGHRHRWRRRRPCFNMDRIEIVVPTSTGEAVFPGFTRKMAFGYRKS
jgi:hypothetical protein